MSNPLESLSFHALFDAAADALLLADDAGNVTLANPAACKLFGYCEAEMLGMSVEMLMPAHFRENHRRFRADFSRHPQKRTMGNGKELLALSRDGRELQVDVGLSPLRVEGQPYVLVTFIDASRRRQAIKALQESEERLRLAKHAAGLGIFDRDLTDNTLHWDERSRELWGLGPGESVTYGKFLARIHPDDLAARNAIIDRAIDPAGNGEYNSEFRIIDPNDGSERWIASTGRVIFENGRAVRFLGVMRDVTSQRVAERKLREQRAEMELLLKQQVAAQTASAIAHELNQPLAALSAYSEVALRELGNIECPEKVSHALAGCVEQAHRAGKTLHELLDFLHKGSLVSAPMDLNETVQEAIVIARNDGLGGFNPVLELEPDLPPVMGNRLQVQKVLTNLVRNGVEAMREAGMPMSAITVRVQTLVEPNMALVTVQDSGPGFDAEMARRIFEPFFTTKSHGIGMGLAICRTLIEANGGQLWVDPAAGSGATFHFTLPFAA